jgi:hypothetical protein
MFLSKRQRFFLEIWTSSAKIRDNIYQAIMDKNLDTDDKDSKTT